ncbi:MAG: hypothetical protein JWO67_3323 [Streptosporangiaceae bacterium]|nr:hypothetical protein [Streptosporangiaceae bacterium]
MTTPTPETLLSMLAELDRIRSLLVELMERAAPGLLPAPPDDSGDGERSAYELLLGARRAVFGHPAAARSLHDLLVAEGRRYASTPAGAQLRDRLIASEGVDRLRRIWETVSLNVLDGPAPPSGVPDAWAELLADAVTAHGLDDTVLARLRPEGFA